MIQLIYEQQNDYYVCHFIARLNFSRSALDTLPLSKAHQDAAPHYFLDAKATLALCTALKMWDPTSKFAFSES